MKKGKIFNLISGILDILLGIAFLAIIALFFLSKYKILPAMTESSLLSFLYLVSPLITSLESIEIFAVYLAIMGIFGICSIIFGSVTINKIRKEPGEYYKRGGNLITFFILELIPLALLVAMLVVSLKAESIEVYLTTITSVLAFIEILRLIGIIRFFCGRKAHFKPAPTFSEYTPTGEKKDAATQLQELSALKDVGDISEKEFLAKKTNLLNDKK